MLLCIELLSSLQSRRILGRDPWIVFRNDVVPPSWTLILPESWDESKSVFVAFQDGGHDQGTSEFSLKNACSAGYCYQSNCFLNFPLFRIVFAWINEEFRIDSEVPSPLKPRFRKFMTGSFRWWLEIISVVIGDHFGGGDHFDGGDHFGGGTPVGVSPSWEGEGSARSTGSPSLVWEP